MHLQAGVYGMSRENVIINFASRLERNKICFISLSVGAEIVVVHWSNFQFHLYCKNIQKFPTKLVMGQKILALVAAARECVNLQSFIPLCFETSECGFAYCQIFVKFPRITFRYY